MKIKISLGKTFIALMWTILLFLHLFDVIPTTKMSYVVAIFIILVLLMVQEKTENLLDETINFLKGIIKQSEQI